MSARDHRKRMRADCLLVERGLCESRSLAQRLIMAGTVRIGTDEVVRKAGQILDVDADVRVLTPDPYVSRGAHKLLAALAAHRPDLNGRVALDVGASTGGFTDVLLRWGVRRVYAVDVGYGQLHWRLRQDERVVCIERQNARHLQPGQVPEPIDVLTMDVSFISVQTVLPACAPLLAPGAWAFVLVKPQFEASRDDVGKGGVVRDPEVQARCVAEVQAYTRDRFGWQPLGVTASPIQGPKGNQEYVVAFRVRPANGDA